MKESLAGAVAVVTGAGRGLGRGIAVALAGDGAHVWASDRAADELDETAAIIERAGGVVRTLRFDLADVTECGDLIANVMSHTAHVHVLVNNAAVLVESTLADMKLADWRSTLAINLTAPFVLTQGFLPHMSEEGGSVINVSSRAGTAPFAGEAAYCASKYGIEALTRCLALELDELPVSANTVTPGLRIKPTGLSEADAATAPEEQRQEWSDPATIAPAFVFLARLEGEFGGLRFDAQRLSEALGEYEEKHIVTRIEEFAE